MDKKKVLWISPYAPYDTAAHAGGKNHNYYLKYLHKSGKFDITLLSLCLKSEEKDLDLQKYGIKNHIYVMDRSPAQKFLRLAVSAWSVKNPYDRYAGLCPTYEYRRLLKLLRQYKELGEVPEFVILQWTFAAMLTPQIRKFYEHCKIISIEEDVTFLGYMRKWKAARSPWQRWFCAKRYRRIKRLELDMLREADLVVTNNPKDTKLLREQGIGAGRLFQSAPYFDDYSGVVRNVAGKDILFYGAMSRAENYESAIWFIEKVMPLLEDQKVRFVIVGSRPNGALLQRQSERVRVEGYVEDVSGYFERCLCFAAPLLLGAGVKIKILEAMSAGIPVLTNHIGIEGIEAEDGKEYLHCETAEEYAAGIARLIAGNIDVRMLSASEKALAERYRPDRRLDELIRRMEGRAGS